MASSQANQLTGFQLEVRLHGPSLFSPADSAELRSSTVYKATHVNREGFQAIKVFPAGLDPDRQLRPLRESLSRVAQLQHPGIPPILGSGMFEGRPYIVLPFLGAGNLSDRYASGLARSLHPGQVLDELAAALDHAHKHGVVHGHLRPSSVLFDEESGGVRLVGLGEEAVQSKQPEPTAPGDSEQEAYRSPEVRSGGPATPRSDQYSFGVVALELLSQKPARSALAALQSPVEAGPAGTKGGSAVLHPDVASTLARATAEDPLRRFATVGEANRALQIALGYLPPDAKAEPEPQPVGPPRPVRRRRRLGFAWILLLMCLLGSVVTIPAFSAGLLKLPGGGSEAVSTPSAPGVDAGPAILLPTENGQSPGEGEPLAGPVGNTLPAADSAGLPNAQPGPTATPLAPGGYPMGPTATPAAATELSSPTATSAGPETPTATSVAPPTNPPPTSTNPPPTPTNPPAPDINPNKCKSDPTHKNYCTPTP